MTDLIKSALRAIELFGGLAVLPIIQHIAVADLATLERRSIAGHIGVHLQVLTLELLRFVCL